jgi:hypothetical protein
MGAWARLWWAAAGAGLLRAQPAPRARPAAAAPPKRTLCLLPRPQPPFNEAARKKAGFGPEWYMPVAKH